MLDFIKGAVNWFFSSMHFVKNINWLWLWDSRGLLHTGVLWFLTATCQSLLTLYNKWFSHIIALLLGWQPRWFVLEVGVLAYYKSQEEVGLGSRGSVKMTCCEISGKLQLPCCCITQRIKTKQTIRSPVDKFAKQWNGFRDIKFYLINLCHNALCPKNQQSYFFNTEVSLFFFDIYVKSIGYSIGQSNTVFVKSVTGCCACGETVINIHVCKLEQPREPVITSG